MNGHTCAKRDEVFSSLINASVSCDNIRSSRWTKKSYNTTYRIVMLSGKDYNEPVKYVCKYSGIVRHLLH